jgi:isopentenyl diphosphate isomerase/L-lactate dehydrogenase-like FMN-dependent dehydrogenase
MDFNRLSFYDWRNLAEKKLGEEKFAYLTSGAGYGSSVEHNYMTFERWKFLPRVLKNNLEADISYSIFGKRVAAPVMLGPVRGLKYFHPEGELAVARAAKKLNIPFVMSNFASATIEEIGKEMGDVPHFLQLYHCNDEEILDSIINRAEKAEYSGLFITVDMASHPVQYKGPKTSEYEKFGHDIYFSDPVFRSKLKRSPEEDKEGALELWRKVRGTKVSWEYVDKIKKKSRLPVIVKGILNPADIEECIKIGADGIVISNHGGRSLDSAVSPLEVLPDISSKFKDKILLFIDSGFRSGMDVIKAIALGAECVLLGRSYVYSLAAGGGEGIIAYMNNMVKEMINTVQSLGYTKISQVGRDSLIES